MREFIRIASLAIQCEQLCLITSPHRLALNKTRVRLWLRIRLPKNFTEKVCLCLRGRSSSMGALEILLDALVARFESTKALKLMQILAYLIIVFGLLLPNFDLL